MDKKIEKLLITHANLNKNEECCGFIVLDTFKKLLIIPCDNIYQFPRQGFKICPKQFLKIKQKHEIVCMYHSHPDGDHEFSQKDLEQSEELCLPICVYSLKTEEFNIHFPNSCEINEFIGRDYVYHFQNCWKLVYDYYNSKNKLIDKNFNFYLKQEQNGTYSTQAILRITDFFKRNKIKKTSQNNIMTDDLIVFQASKKNFSHFGVALEDNEFMHHQEMFLSSKALLDDNYLKKIHSIYRIEG